MSPSSAPPAADPRAGSRRRRVGTADGWLQEYQPRRRRPVLDTASQPVRDTAAPQFELPALDVPQFDVAQLDVPELDVLCAVGAPPASITVRAISRIGARRSIAVFCSQRNASGSLSPSDTWSRPFAR